jgi:outer membrane protein OmpA-like peptidoglycan-associated protein
MLGVADVYFETNSAEIDPAIEELLRRSERWRSSRRTRISAFASTATPTARGTDAYNQQLSERRAAAVRKFSSTTGSTGARSNRGFGESQPAAPNDTRRTCARNRRVEFTPL